MFASSGRAFRSAAWLVALTPTLFAVPRAASQELQHAHLGRCPLEQGGFIEECVVSYRTLGTLDPGRNNAVLFPTWAGGTSQQLVGAFAGPDGWVSPEEHFVILVDAFGNGVSSSPSTSATQPGTAFPAFTIRDIVRAQHRLVTEVLGLDGLHAVVGISLGGLMAFEWVTSYPGFARRGVAVVATPRVSANDLLWSHVAQRTLAGCEPDRCDDARETYAALFRLTVRSPGHWNRTLGAGEMPAVLEGVARSAAALPPAQDLLSQLRAVESMDVAAPFGGSMESAAAAVRSRLLVAVAEGDQVVGPGPSREFARLTGGRLVELDPDCGHQAFVCEIQGLGREVRAFLR